MIFKLLVDFGLVILIWMTQLVVYPSFTYFPSDSLLKWHEKYTTSISVIVMPLMLAQIGVHGYLLLATFSWTGAAAFGLVLLAWINTFLFAVPQHNRIANQDEVVGSAKNLVRINWYRTVIWSVVFLLSLYEYLQNT